MFDHDVLTDLLHPLHLTSVFHSRWVVRGPWNVQGDDDECAVLHYVLRNRCFVTIDGKPPIVLHEGDLAVFPYGTAHTLGDGSTEPTQPLESVLTHRRLGSSATIRLGTEGETTELMCASVHYDPAGEPPLYRSLPAVIVLDRHMLAQEPLLTRTLECLVPETERAGPGSQLIALRAFEMVFVLALRVALQNRTTDNPALHALIHPGISKALSAIYTDFEQPWSLHTLARRAGMSRSTFAKTFRDLVGEGPAQHLTRRRMREAVRLLTDTSTPLSAIPQLVGYQSTVGFHLAFRKTIGDTPGSYRQRKHRQPRHGTRTEAMAATS
ncbi:AraC family transcriptional regulator [Actinoplanes sp. NPDC049802]|uniref:AraC family transcriptional regulator n=1 Tax=Actinoplanes sp. NPDC049802 TaxID=3154742 RepID=UPI0033FE5B99